MVFVDNDDGKTVKIKGSDTKLPSPEFVEVEVDYGNASNEGFNLALVSDEELEQRLAKLKDFNKDILENETKRTKLIDEKIKKLSGYKKKLGKNEASREIVNGTFVTDYRSISFKVFGIKGEYLTTPRNWF